MPVLRLKTFDVDNSIFIFSEPRGGSTWLMEMISKLPKSAAIFEPFHSHYGALDDYTWGNHYYEKDKWEAGQSGIQEILDANKFDSYQLERASWSELINAKQLIFKCVMGTPILPWIVANIKLKYKPIYILRHPLSVACSTLENLYKRGEVINVDHRWTPSGYTKALYEKNIDLFSEKTPMIDQLIARWCINNHYALTKKDDKWIQVFYEDMLIEPKATLSSIFEQWSIQIPNDLWNDLDKPSHSDFKKDFRKNKNDQLRKWIKKHSESELAHFQQILDRFGIELYSMNNPLPKNGTLENRTKTKVD